MWSTITHFLFILVTTTHEKTTECLLKR